MSLFDLQRLAQLHHQRLLDEATIARAAQLARIPRCPRGHRR